VKILALAFALTLSGCAVMPNDISPEIVHMSHAVQHFGATPTNFGVNIAQLTARWNLPHNVHIEMSEGLARSSLQKLDTRSMFIKKFNQTALFGGEQVLLIEIWLGILKLTR